MSDRRRDSQINAYLRRMQEGDIAALAPLYDCTSKPLYALCYSYFRNCHDAEDAVSETFLRIQLSIHSFKGDNGYAWMSTVARNICINMLKKQNRSVSVDMDDEMTVRSLGIDQSEPPPVFEEEAEIVTVAKSVLNEHELQVLILHAVNEERFKHIAELLGKNEATVRWQYHNAIKKVKKAYERRART